MLTGGGNTAGMDESEIQAGIRRLIREFSSHQLQLISQLQIQLKSTSPSSSPLNSDDSKEFKSGEGIPPPPSSRLREKGESPSQCTSASGSGSSSRVDRDVGEYENREISATDVGVSLADVSELSLAASQVGLDFSKTELEDIIGSTLSMGLGRKTEQGTEAGGWQQQWRREFEASLGEECDFSDREVVDRIGQLLNRLIQERMRLELQLAAATSSSSTDQQKSSTPTSSSPSASSTSGTVPLDTFRSLQDKLSRYEGYEEAVNGIKAQLLVEHANFKFTTGQHEKRIEEMQSRLNRCVCGAAKGLRPPPSSNSTQAK